MRFSDERCALFEMDMEHCLMGPADLGIINGHATVGTPYADVCGLDTFFAPPYTSSNLAVNVRIMGVPPPCTGFCWYPHAIDRFGAAEGLLVRTRTAMCAGARSLVQRVQIRNDGCCDVVCPVQITFAGGMYYQHQWDFSRPTEVKPGDLSVFAHRLLRHNNDKAMVLSCTLSGLSYVAPAGMWQAEARVPAGGEAVFYLCLSLGAAGEAQKENERLLGDPQAALMQADEAFSGLVERLFARLPSFDSDSPALDAFWARSLVHYLTNEWNVPEFLLHPYFSVGSVRGGCLAGYLWDYSEGWELHALYDPAANRAHIRHYLSIDISRCYAYNPVYGNPIGPWYPVNHEKILGLIYHYVRLTGDTAFLHEEVGGRMVAQWAEHHALIRDDLSAPVALTDYGIDGEQHLELRRGYPYRGVLPDLNGRRYQNLLWAHEITRLAGAENPLLLQRAAGLKALLLSRLWDGERCWFAFEDMGVRDFRYTVQMFKLFHNPVLDEAQEEGLLSHLSEGHFLGRWGLHSIALQDPCYDQADIDNGGGGACTIFPVQIAERLYKAGHAAQADDMLRRVLWWGGRMPYWGDSFVANAQDYRRDTPLQCTIGGVSGAQCLLFGLLGVGVNDEGAVTVSPKPTSLAGRVRLRNLRLRGRSIDIDVDVNAGRFTVLEGGKPRAAPLGQTIALV